ncbi:restriction endonuclease subunit S [Prevotella intermedia]|uniref:restriction endonuclease subunit S n=1 Tax=Prevotella intermedia TaxID=28131 RepID=UPI000C1C5147|nr:restriction endonuclease subunit S [Prevotella intermedia]ATV39306.1 restriction endonuclease subunit S [Prevotella intermedia]
MTTTIDNEHKIFNVPNLRFPEFEGEWQEKRLSDIADLSKGIGISKDQLSADGEPCILYGELYTKYKSETIKEVISKTNIDNTKLVKSKANDVIIPCSGETAEEIATARCVLKDDILLGGDLNIIRLHGYDGSFMSYQLNGKRKYDIAKVAQGVSVVHLYGEHLKNIKTINPSLNEQKKIANLLSLLDERISTQNKIIEKLESLIKGIAQSIAQGHKANILISECLGCSSSSLQESDVLEHGTYPVYGANGIVGYLDNYNTENEAIYIIKDGSGVGSISYVTGKCSATGTLNILRAKEGYSLQYLYYMLKVFNFEPYKTGMAIPHIYFKDYGKDKVFCPTYKEQLQYSRLLSAIDKRLTVEHGLLTSLSLQKQYLLRQMFI